MRKLLLGLLLLPIVALAQPMPGTSVRVNGPVAATQSGTWDEVGINDSGNSITVDGAVSCTLAEPISVDDNASSLTVDGTVTVTDGSGALNVIVDSSALPSGASTLAEQQTQTTHLATIAGDTTDIETATELLDDTVATVASAITTKGIAAAGTDGTNARILKTDTGGELQVDVLSAPTTTVTGTVACTQSGTWDEVGINDSGNSITVDGTVTVGTFPDNEPINVAQMNGVAVSMGSGANGTGVQRVTLATDDELNDDADAIRVATELIDDTVTTLGTTTYTEATSKGLTCGAVRRDADTTLVNTTNEFGPLQMDANGRLKVEIFDGGDSHTVDNAGTFAVQVDGSALTALQLIDDVIFTDDTSTHTPATTKVAGIGMVADDASTDSVNEGDIGMPRMTLDRKSVVTLQPYTVGGLDVANFTSGDTFTALTSTAQAIKASAGQIYGYYIHNPNTSTAYVIVYNIASGSVTVGTSTPKLVFAIPAGSSANVEFSNGIAFDTAMSAAATTTGGGNTAPTTALEAMFFYK